MSDFNNIRDLLSKEELAELIPPTVEAEDLLRQTAVEVRSSLMEQTIKYWEQTVFDLQKEVRELKNRIDRLEHWQKDEKPSSLPAVLEPEPKVTPEERLSRTERHRSYRGRWF